MKVHPCPSFFAVYVLFRDVSSLPVPAIKQEVRVKKTVCLCDCILQSCIEAGLIMPIDWSAGLIKKKKKKEFLPTIM